MSQLMQNTQRPLLRVEGLTVQYPGLTGLRRRPAVDQLDLTVFPGESVGLVGGSGAGKSTVARALAGLVEPQRGRIVFAGRDLLDCSPAAARRRRRTMHLVLQDPYASLPPNYHVGAIVAEQLVIHKLVERRLRLRAVVAAMELVGLTPVASYLERFPHQLSGGERQRVAFARAVVTEPQLILADEPTQMLDASLRRELVDLLDELRERRGMAVLYITDDLSLARRGCDRLVVLRGGKVVEQGPTAQVLARPKHPYTAALIDAASGTAKVA